MNVQLASNSRISSPGILPRKFSGLNEKAESNGGASEDTVTLTATSVEAPEVSPSSKGSDTVKKLKRSAWRAAWLGLTAAVGMFTLVGCVPPPAATHDAPKKDAIEQVETSVPSTFRKDAEKETPKTELEVRIRELELREREIALREKELAQNNNLDASQKRVNDLRARQIQRQEAEKKAENIANTIEGGAKLLDLLGKEVNKTLR